MRVSIADHVSGVLVGMLVIGIVASLALAVHAGPLDPTAPLGSNLKRLADVPGAWRSNLSTNGTDPCQTERFQCVLSATAVLDQETGLVWERVPYSGAYVAWADAAAACINKVVGDRSGWRLPTVAEMRSLLVFGQSPPLAPNHPFTVTVAAFEGVWTASVDLGDRTLAYFVRLDNGSTSTITKTIAGERYWCVRAPDPATPR